MKSGVVKLAWAALFVIFAVPIILFAAGSSEESSGIQVVLFLSCLTLEISLLAGAIELQKRIDGYALLKTDEILQYKDAVMIGTGSALVMIPALYVAGATAASTFHSPPQAIFITFVAALAAFALAGC